MTVEQRIVEVTPRTARRQFTKAFKRDLVQQALRPDVSMAAVAIANELNTNQLARWCREHLKAQGETRTPEIIPVHVAPMSAAPIESPSQANTSGGEIEWRHGQSVVVVRGAVDEATLRIMLAYIKTVR